MEALKAHIETGLENSSEVSEAQHPRWVRINSLKTTIEEQLESTFAGLERSSTINGVRKRGGKAVYVDANVPNLVAVSPNVDLSKSDAYKKGEIIFQDKASCFPAYLLDPLVEDGDIIDTCSAPGNKTTHLAAILLAHNSEADECTQTIHAFEKNKLRAETLDKMVHIAGSDVYTKLHPGQDFLKTDPTSSTYKNVGALLLDPSCSGSGIIGRDEMPELHLPVLKEKATPSHKSKEEKMKGDPNKELRKRKREDKDDVLDRDVLIDDDGVVTAVTTDDELKARLAALSTFQLELLLHAFKFPAARKLTYSTCSVHKEENEEVVLKALQSPIAKERGWRLLKREEQVRGMREWPVRGVCEDADVAEACIRANKDDEHGTMGFFLAGFTRGEVSEVDLDTMETPQAKEQDVEMDVAEDEEWGGIEEEVVAAPKPVEDKPKPPPQKKKKTAPVTVAVPEPVEVEAKALPQKKQKPTANKHAHNAGQKRPGLVPKGKKKGGKN